MKKTILVLDFLLVAVVAFLAGRASKTFELQPEVIETVSRTRRQTAVAAVRAPVAVVPPAQLGAPPAIPVPTATTPAADAATAEPPLPPLEPAAGQTQQAPVPVTKETTATQSAPSKASPSPESASPRPLIVPVAGVPRSAMREMFNEVRGNRRHEAIDILAPRGTLVIAADDGIVKKLFTSKPGGLTVYQFDPDERFCYYYAHLDSYAPGLVEGQHLHRGDPIGRVGTTGNAPKETPHLHFALIRLDPDKRWWKGTYLDPYPLLK